jgi:hypothetical protein
MLVVVALLTKSHVYEILPKSARERFIPALLTWYFHHHNDDAWWFGGLTVINRRAGKPHFSLLSTLRNSIDPTFRLDTVHNSLR